jgi:hypothetical protein
MKASTSSRVEYKESYINKTSLHLFNYFHMYSLCSLFILNKCNVIAALAFQEKACHKRWWRTSTRYGIIIDFHHRQSIGAVAGFPLLPAHAQEPQKRTPALYGHGCPRSGRTRPSRPRHDRLMWPLRGRWTSRTAGSSILRACGQRLAGSPYVGGTSASAVRRLCAACVPPLPSFATRTPSSVRRQSTGHHEATTTSNKQAGSTVAGRPYHRPSKIGRERARTRRHDDPSETSGQDREVVNRVR